jgi:glutathione synthase/RimK-type ligase-like ATP-grasp enzyme
VIENDDRHADVIAVTQPADSHWAVTREQLLLSECTAIRFSLADLRTMRFVARDGCLRLNMKGRSYAASSKTTVWWRKPGSVDTSDLDEEEARLAYDEGPHLLLGALEAADARFVDHPYVVARAEMKQLQLAIARNLGIAVPATLVTNDPDTARAFTAGRKIVAKAVSPGFGIAPYVSEVLETDLEALKALPTLLQELVRASADLRVVVVGHESWVWRRQREPGTIDWRQADPEGSRFVPIVNEELGASACEIASALRLSISVQDWLETDSGVIFLESNAQGAWLFLEGSQDLVAPAIASHLRARHE